MCQLRFVRDLLIADAKSIRLKRLKVLLRQREQIKSNHIISYCKRTIFFHQTIHN